MSIKYIGSKRRLVPVIAAMAEASGAKSALDLFTGTTRVARALKAAGAHVTAVDSASYSHVFAEAYIATDARDVDRAELGRIIDRLNALEGREGYVTEVFCRTARYFHPDNGRRIDAIRHEIDEVAPPAADGPLACGGPAASGSMRALLLTSLLEAADRVDSTTGLQMAYLKDWAPRALRPIRLELPQLLAGRGTALAGDAVEVCPDLPEVDLAYLDPPYNQHRYFTNYHVWETLVRWDAPPHYGIACKRLDSRDASTASRFNRKREMPSALASVVSSTRARLMLLSYNDESFLGLSDLVGMCSGRGAVDVLKFDSKRYVGARIGIHSPSGERVGKVGRLRNEEWLVVSGEPDLVERAVRAVREPLGATLASVSR